VSIVIPTPLLHVVANFADHHHRLAAAVAARGETIVTGDRKACCRSERISAFLPSPPTKPSTGWMPDARPDPCA